MVYNGSTLGRPQLWTQSTPKVTVNGPTGKSTLFNMLPIVSK